LSELCFFHTHLTPRKASAAANDTVGKTAEFLNLPGGFHPTWEQKKWKKQKLQKLRFSES